MRDKTYRDTEEAVLPPELYGESEGLTPEEAAEDTAPIPGDAAKPSDLPDIVPDDPEPASQPDAAPEGATEPDAPKPVNAEPTTDKPAVAKPAPTPKPSTPALPEYEPGSEGDDPLLD